MSVTESGKTTTGPWFSFYCEADQQFFISFYSQKDAMSVLGGHGEIIFENQINLDGT